MEYDKYGRRGKPQRELYTPGSGPLRKTGKEDIFNHNDGIYYNPGSCNSATPRTDGSPEISKISERLKRVCVSSARTSECEEMKADDNSKRSRKPDYEIYVPKPVAQAHAMRLKEKDSKISDFNCVDTQEKLPAKSEKKTNERRKREKKKRSKNLVTDSDRMSDEKSLIDSEKFKSRESLCSEERDNFPPNRFLRYGSEPRSLPLVFQDSRLKDVRSNDSSWSQEKTRSKPPLGRRGSLSKGNSKPFPPSFDSLPPRLQKKFIAENGISEVDKVSYIGNTTEGVTWDGSTVTFQGKSPPSNNGGSGDIPPQRGPRSLAEWSKTLPSSGRAKGRGRLNRETHIDLREPIRFSRSLTPEALHDSQFENASEDDNTKFSCNRAIQEKESRPLRNRLEPVLSNQRESKREPIKQRIDLGNEHEIKSDLKKCLDNSDAENVLDWAAEVERCEKQDTVPLSSANSKESFTEPAPPPPKEKKKRRNRRTCKEHKERSVSREESHRNVLRRGSVDNITNYSRNNSIERNWRERGDNRSRQNSSCDNRSRQSSIDRRENFNNRFSRSRQNSSCDNRSRQSSLDRREKSYSGRGRGLREDRTNNRGKYKEDRNVSKLVEETNWRLEQEILAKERDQTSNSNAKPAGILVLPQPISPPAPPTRIQMNNVPLTHIKKLYDPCNPDKPIVVPSNRPIVEDESKYLCNTFYPEIPPLINANMVEQLNSAKPIWYNPYTENFQASHNQQLIRAIEQADCELQYLLASNELLKYWDRMQLLRNFLKDTLKRMLLTDLRFCELENVEQHLWKILYYNVIELLRKLMTEQNESKENYKHALLVIIEEGSEYYEKLLNDLETANNIKLDIFLNTPMCMRENLKYTVLPLIAAQKIYLSLGDLARYKEQANETCNYGVARQWYMKAHQINPKNGRPYNQLAILALYTKRKLDAVYYYMRCLMSSNPISAARESLVTLFDESRKKYEAVDRKRKEEKAKREREKMKEKEGGGGIRREIWIHPGGRKNMHRTTSTCKTDYDSEDEELYAASDIEVNKKFVTSYLHVHGKIFTKIGLESLTETALQMLKQFRALLQHSPLPLNSNRFLQLFALNMFAIEISQPKGDVVTNSDEGCYRSATQESALVISLQMFNLVLERFVKVLQEHINNSNLSSSRILPADCLEMLPALKVWCDWLMTHVEIWNPPPSCQDYKVGPSGDCWSRIAMLVNLLEKIDYKSNLLSTENHPDHELVYLPEDATLSGFTPLMANIQEPKYRHKNIDLELAQVSLRIHKMLFFGTLFLCGLDPPVLKLQKVETGAEYISVVDTENIQEQVLIDEHETWSESEDSGKDTGLEEEEHEMMGLAARRRQLQQQAKSRVSQMARITNALTEMEIRPHDLVPDTNCFIECLPELETILRVLPHPQHPYVLMVPLVVMNELEGLSRGCKPSQSVHHSALVRETAKAAMALFQKRHPALRTCTTRGTVLSSTTFTLEEDSGVEMTNDDKILTTCMNLCRTFNKDEIKEGGRRKLYRDVVLLTEDRNLTLKAMARDMPVRSLPDFIRWAGLG